jgi:hypothetical protein
MNPDFIYIVDFDYHDIVRINFDREYSIVFVQRIATQYRATVKILRGRRFSKIRSSRQNTLFPLRNLIL